MPSRGYRDFYKQHGLKGPRGHRKKKNKLQGYRFIRSSRIMLKKRLDRLEKREKPC